MISFENVNKSFGRLQVLKNISFEMEAGQSVALIGPNGSGKTTLIKTLLGMNVPTSGKIRVKGYDIQSDYHYRAHIGYMPQIGNYPKNLKISQLIDMMRDIRREKGVVQKTDEELIDLFHLRDIYDKPLGTLSGGTRQKVSATLAFLFNPEILILDEPTAGLDPLSSEILKEKILEESLKGKLIIITSHILADLEELATHIMYLEEGNLQLFKKLSDIKEETGENRLSRIIAHLMSKKETAEL
ncbi:ABC transporter ATP-binding protein [Leadbetterella sp. DM7]|uniref:ABC transporter ATP-binding protein n=1 Tax=Leadbetterella sp. DM7 TaxID=3235085 RepID=UPI00349E9501